MDWVENNIDDAVKKSKILNSLFIVLVEGIDIFSKTYISCK